MKDNSAQVSSGTSGRNTVDALVGEFMAEQRVEQEELAKAGAARHRRRGVRTGAVALLAITSWTAPLGPAPLDESLAPALTAAGAQLTLGLAASRIEEFLRVSGRLPSSLGEAGIEEEGLQFMPGADQRFTLQLPSDAGIVTFESSTEPGNLVDAAAPRIARTGM